LADPPSWVEEALGREVHLLHMPWPMIISRLLAVVLFGRHDDLTYSQRSSARLRAEERWA
jgi:hypothetical protein